MPLSDDRVDGKRYVIRAQDGPNFVGPPTAQQIVDRITRECIEDQPTMKFGPYAAKFFSNALYNEFARTKGPSVFRFHSPDGIFDLSGSDDVVIKTTCT